MTVLFECMYMSIYMDRYVSDFLKFHTRMQKA